jgi:uncharacterized protein with HEPN domain
MSERSDQEFLSDIREAIQRISAYVMGLDYEAFVKDTKTQDAVIRNLEILGEALTNKVRSSERSERRSEPFVGRARYRGAVGG